MHEQLLTKPAFVAVNQHGERGDGEIFVPLKTQYVNPPGTHKDLPDSYLDVPEYLTSPQAAAR